MQRLTRHSTRALALITTLSLLLLVIISSPVFAQAKNSPFVKLLTVDKSRSPIVDLWLYGDGLDGNLRSAQIEISEDEKAQTIVEDSFAQTGIQLAVVIEPGQGNEAATILRTLVERAGDQPVLLRLQDQIAAYSSTTDGKLQTIQDWTNEPNLLYNSVASTLTEIAPSKNSPNKNASRATATNNDRLTSLLLQAMANFDLAQNPLVQSYSVKTILLFATSTSQVDVESVVDSAAQQGIHIHVIDLGEAAAEPAPLQQIAEQTQGHFVQAAPAEQAELIWQSLLAYHNQRHLSYQSSATAPKQVAVVLHLDQATTLKASAPLPASTVADNNEGSATAAQTAFEAPSTNEPSAATTPAPGTTVILIPGINVAVSRNALLLALPVLLALLLFLIYREARERRRNRPGDYQLATPQKPGAKQQPVYELLKQAKNNLATRPLTEESVPLRPLVEAQRRPPSKGKPNSESRAASGADELGGEQANGYVANQPIPLLRRPMMNGNTDLGKAKSAPVENFRPEIHPEIHPEINEEENEEDDLATFVSLNFSDDEATYRLRDTIEQPIIGKLVRISNNPNLPQQLPIYGLNPGLGQARQIHIGRHSKNNSVVINDKAISREHALLIQKEGRLYLRDNASSSGTYLNWRRLQPGEELLLRHNDLIGFGEIRYEFHAKGEDEATIGNP